MSNPQEAPPDYKAMPAHEMLAELKDDAHKWATAFCQIFPDADHGTMCSWFANAIETSYEWRQRWVLGDDGIPKG